MTSCAITIPRKYEIGFMGVMRIRLSVSRSLSPTMSAVVPPRQLKNKAAPISIPGAVASNELPCSLLPEYIKPNRMSISIGKIAQNIRFRFVRSNSFSIRCVVANDWMMMSFMNHDFMRSKIIHLAFDPEHFCDLLTPSFNQFNSGVPSNMYVYSVLEFNKLQRNYLQMLINGIRL